MTTEEFIFDLPLYKKVKISENSIFQDLQDPRLRVDGYNPIRDTESTFHLKTPIDYRCTEGEYARTLIFECQRYGDNLFVMVHFDVCEDEDYREKVGQYPSVADMHIAQIKQYSKVLGKDYLRDFTRAIGLAANGVGTGSYVYLRRIFEHLVDEISKTAIAASEIDKEAFNTSKMDNKLKMLENHLPDVMKDNKSLYGVLSKGIHELSEKDCLLYFPVLRQVIELILDDIEYTRQKEQKKKEAHNKLSAIVGEIKK